VEPFDVRQDNLGHLVGALWNNREAGQPAEVTMEIVNAAQHVGGFADHLAALCELGGVMCEPFAQRYRSRWRFGEQQRLHPAASHDTLSERKQSRSADAVAFQAEQETRSAHFERGLWSAP
jgi:hypothetical protein